MLRSTYTRAPTMCSLSCFLLLFFEATLGELLSMPQYHADLPLSVALCAAADCDVVHSAPVAAGLRGTQGAASH
jgi:hypothetical protein